ncbi:MAG: hypothetical protein ACREIM_06495 [Nitrospiraceae bacterium]
MSYVRCAIIVLMLVLCPVWAMAHGTGQHVLGTVVTIDATHIEVKTQKGASVSVNLTDKTTFSSKMLKRPSGRPEAGDRVVIEVMTEGNVIIATEVQFSSPKPKGTK